MIYDIPPVAKPRMTRSDKWKKRPAVVKYWEFKDKVRELGLKVTPKSIIVFYVQMPKSWSKKKKRDMFMKPHTQKPDCDNFYKGLTDAIYGEDSHIWRINAEKRWGWTGQIQIIEPINRELEPFETDFEE